MQRKEAIIISKNTSRWWIRICRLMTALWFTEHICTYMHLNVSTLRTNTKLSYLLFILKQHESQNYILQSDLSQTTKGHPCWLPCTSGYIYPNMSKDHPQHITTSGPHHLPVIEQALDFRCEIPKASQMIMLQYNIFFQECCDDLFGNIGFVSCRRETLLSRGKLEGIL